MERSILNLPNPNNGMRVDKHPLLQTNYSDRGALDGPASLALVLKLMVETFNRLVGPDLGNFDSAAIAPGDSSTPSLLPALACLENGLANQFGATSLAREEPIQQQIPSILAPMLFPAKSLQLQGQLKANNTATQLSSLYGICRGEPAGSLVERSVDCPFLNQSGMGQQSPLPTETKDDDSADSFLCRLLLLQALESEKQRQTQISLQPSIPSNLILQRQSVSFPGVGAGTLPLPSTAIEALMQELQQAASMMPTSTLPSTQMGTQIDPCVYHALCPEMYRTDAKEKEDKTQLQEFLATGESPSIHLSRSAQVLENANVENNCRNTNDQMSIVNSFHHTNHSPLTMPREGFRFSSTWGSDGQDELDQSFVDENREYFPCKLYRLLTEVESEDRADIISFTPSGKAFKIHKPQAFMEVVAPRYFRNTRIKSFKRQLNLYGFRSMAATIEGRCSFSHELFRRDEPQLLRGIVRVHNNKNKPKSVQNTK